MSLGREVHREGLGEQVGVALPASDDLGGQGRGGPSVHDVRVPDEAASNATLGLLVAGRCLGGRVDWQGRLLGQQRVVVVGLAG